MSRRHVSAEVEKQILAAIRTGAYPEQAAQAFGIPHHEFARLLKQGRKQKRGVLRNLCLEVMQAKAQAPIMAEREARNKDVRFWLRYGPGKDGSRSIWGPPQKGNRRQSNWLASKRINQILGFILEALDSFPEARRAVLEKLDESESSE